jgi:hypothetical protein
LVDTFVSWRHDEMRRGRREKAARVRSAPRAVNKLTAKENRGPRRPGEWIFRAHDAPMLAPPASCEE